MATGDKTYRASYGMSLTASESIEVSGSIDHKNEVKLRGSGSLSATTAPPVSGVWGDDITIGGGGTGTLDLSALTGATIATGAAMPDADFTKKKLQILAIECPAANTAAVVFVVGAANGYLFMGGAADQVILGPGCSFMMSFNDNLADVSATVKNIDYSGTAADIFNITLVAG